MGLEKVTIFDTTLRDGEQSPGCSMNLGEKIRMARQLELLGVDILEAGFPIASDGDFEAVRAVAREVRGPVVAGLARAKREDIERAWEALREAARPRIHTFLATSDIHLEHKLRITREQALRQIREMVSLAGSFCDDVQFSPEDATRTELGFLCAAVEAAIEEGASTINIPDTVGYTMPSEFFRIIEHLRRNVRGIDKAVISVHCHDDLGMAVANSIAGVEAGARQVECTVNGIGERAGNAALEEVIMILRVRSATLPFDVGVREAQLYPSSALLTELTGVAVQPHKAVVGRNAFAHEAGIHQDGVIKNRLTYEIMTPQSVGAPDSRLVLGKHSGRHALGVRLEKLGYRFDRRELDRLYRRFIRLADEIKCVEDVHLLEIVQAERQPRQAAG
jgi:2-isopropylmalate synthase